MVSLKQIEALNWIVELGSFQRAADRLNTTQSAVSKRISELETVLGFVVFDRRERKLKLTAEGARVLTFGREMLALADRVRQIQPGNVVEPSILRMGITQLSAATWLPRFINGFSEHYGQVEISLTVDIARNLYDAISDDVLDIAVLPDFYSDEFIVRHKVADLESGLMVSPKLMPCLSSVDIDELRSKTFLGQTLRSAAGSYYNRWLKAQGVKFRQSIYSDSLVALAGMAVAQLGVVILPLHAFQNLIHDHSLATMDISVPIPSIPYSVIYRVERSSHFMDDAVGMVIEHCDFTVSMAGIGR